MDLSEEILKKLRLKKGKAFRGVYPDGSPKEHVCIIVNPDCDGMNNMYYVFMSSQEDNLKLAHQYDPHSLVELEEHEYKKYFDYPRPTFISCRKAAIHILNEEQLKCDILSKVTHLEDSVDDSVMIKIVEGIKATKTLTHNEKEEIIGHIFKE